MKKLIATICLICSFTFTFAQDEDLLEQQEEVQKIEAEEEKQLSKQEKEEAKKAAAEKKKAEREDKKRKKNERTDRYLGVVYLPRRNFSTAEGNVAITLRGGTGSFNIYGLAKNSKSTVFSVADDSSSSYFSVLYDGIEYRLNYAAAVTPEVRELDGSCQLAYTLEKSLQVVLDFSILKSSPDVASDMVKISVYTTNLTEQKHTVGVKALFDTILGENTDWHFVMADGEKINSETQYTDLKDNPWISSSNGKTSVQLIYSGKTISPLQALSVANRDSLYRSTWIPVVNPEKGFSSVLAYNNSAVCLNWPSVELEGGKTNVITMYVAVGVDGAEPGAKTFLEGLEKIQENEVEVVVEKNDFVVKKPDVDFVVAPITDYQMDPAYIQNLIDRINALQSDPKLVDRTEVRQLNAELDAILEKIRQQN